MKRISLIKKGLCLMTIPLLCGFLVACSNTGNKNVLANKKYLKGIDYFVADKSSAPEVKQFIPDGKKGEVSYPYVLYEDSSTCNIFSVYNSDKIIYSGPAETSYFDIYNADFEIPYLHVCIEEDNIISSQTVYDPFGTIVLEAGDYESFNILVESYDYNRVSKNEYVYSAYEYITYTIDGKRNSITNELKFTFSDPLASKFSDMQNLERTPLSDASSISPYSKDAMLGNGRFIDLSLIGMQGYYTFNEDYVYDIYNEKNELITTINLEIEGIGNNAWLCMNGYLFVQYSSEVPYDSDDFDYYLPTEDGLKKADLITYCINLKNGKRKELKNFKYVVNEIIPVTYDNISKNETNTEVFALYSTSAQKIVDKKLIYETAHLYFTAKGKILGASTTHGFGYIKRIDDDHYIGFDSLLNGFWLLNSKVEKVSYLGTKASFTLVPAAKAIVVTTASGYDAIINYEGKLITNIKYKQCEVAYENKLIAYDSNNDIWLLTIEDGNTITEFKMNIDLNVNSSSFSNIQYDGDKLLYNNNLIVQIDYQDGEYDIIVNSLDGSELINTSCFGYSLKCNSPFDDRRSATLCLYSEENEILAIYIIE